MKTMKTYTELITIPTFQSRFEYLQLPVHIPGTNSKLYRHLAQIFYQSDEWAEIRRKVILRDNGFDMGCVGFEIQGPIFVHHIEPITQGMIGCRHPLLLTMDNLISVSRQTHDAIHYSDPNLLPTLVVERKPNDTTPWL